MTAPSPAIVTQEAVRPLPRPLLWLLCLAYVLPGFFGRAPWRGADMASHGFMQQLQQAGRWSDWLHPQLFGLSAEPATLLPYWLGAAALKLLPADLGGPWLARLPFVLMLAATLWLSWRAVFYLACHRGAQPVAFAFGGEANTRDYARALADGGLLALIATLGLAQFSHEAAPALSQLLCVALIFYGLAALPFKTRTASLALLAGFPGLMVSGAPGTALVYVLLAFAVLLRPATEPFTPALRRHALLLLGALGTAGLALAWFLGWLDWPKGAPAWPSSWAEWRTLGRLLLWFAWPVWPLVLWTLWRWRRQLLHLGRHRHLALPLLLASVPLARTVFSPSGGDRALLLALPALASLAAFALPTFKRSAAALIDWFTVLFFSAGAIVIWVVWVSLQTGVPAKPAANVARLAPGFESVFQWPALVLAVLGTLGWLALVRWRTGRHRAALWKSLVLPASGATLCWLLLMSLWLPALDYGRSEAAQIRQLQTLIGSTPTCVHVQGLNASQVAALHHFGGWEPVQLKAQTSRCPWLVTSTRLTDPSPQNWAFAGRAPRPTQRQDVLLLYRRVGLD